MNEEPELVCSATLIILNEDLDPRMVTQLLQLEPHQSWSRGERRSFVRKDGAVHYFDSVYGWGGWKRFLPEDQQALELPEQLEYWCNLLENRISELQELVRQGCWMELSCFVAASETVTLLLNTELQERLAKFKLNISICYSPDVVENEAEQNDEPDREQRIC